MNTAAPHADRHEQRGETDYRQGPDRSRCLILTAPLVMAEALKLADFQPPTHFVVDTVYSLAEAVAAGINNDLTVKLSGNPGSGRFAAASKISVSPCRNPSR